MGPAALQINLLYSHTAPRRQHFVLINHTLHALSPVAKVSVVAQVTFPADLNATAYSAVGISGLAEGASDPAHGNGARNYADI
jgi:hypothetical protein